MQCGSRIDGVPKPEALNLSTRLLYNEHLASEAVLIKRTLHDTRLFRSIIVVGIVERWERQRSWFSFINIIVYFYLIRILFKLSFGGTLQEVGLDREGLGNE